MAEKKTYKKKYSVHKYTVTTKDGETLNKMYFAGEVTCTKDPDFHPGAEDGSKKSFATVGIAVGDPVGMILDLAKGKYSKDKEYQDHPFMDLKAFGYSALDLNKVGKKGANLAVAGNFHIEEYQTNAGEKKKKVVLVADIIHLIDKSPYFSSRKSVEEEEEEETKKPPKSTSKAKEREPDPDPEDDEDEDEDIPF